jgi:hypothetical protein
MDTAESPARGGEPRGSGLGRGDRAEFVAGQGWERSEPEGSGNANLAPGSHHRLGRARGLRRHRHSPQVAVVVETRPVPGRPEDRSAKRVVSDTIEDRLTALFRRWPALSDREAGELRRLWDERVQQTKQRR